MLPASADALSLPRVRATPSLAFAFDALRCAFALLPATILWGASFPLTLAIGRQADFDRHVARVNAINTAGALAGAIAFTLIGIPLLGSHMAQQALVLFAGLSGAMLLATSAIPARKVWLLGAAAVTVIAMLIVPAVPAHLIAYGRSVNSWQSIARFLYLAEGATASVAVTQHVGGARQFHIAGKVEASDMDIDMRLERMLGHIPALLHPHPRSVLIVGVGAGVTAGALSIHPEVERIASSRIDPVVPLSARRIFGEANHHVFDIRASSWWSDMLGIFCKTTDEKFDVITSTRSILGSRRGDALLLEYLSLVKDHLTPAVGVTQWIPLYETDMRSVKSEIGTFAKVVSGYDVVESRSARGRLRPRRVRARRADADQPGGDPGAARHRAARQEIARRGGVEISGDILGTYAAAAAISRRGLADAEINL